MVNRFRKKADENQALEDDAQANRSSVRVDDDADSQCVVYDDAERDRELHSFVAFIRCLQQALVLVGKVP